MQSARAVDGAANRALTLAIAVALGVRPSAVSLRSGRGRDKTVDVEGADAAALERLRP